MAEEDNDTLADLAAETDAASAAVSEKLEKTLGYSDGEASESDQDIIPEERIEEKEEEGEESPQTELETEEFTPGDTDDDIDDIDDDDDTATEAFDIQKTLDSIKGMKAGDLRKVYLSTKAEKQHLELEQGKLQQRIDEQDASIEDLNNQLKVDKSRVPAMDIEQHEPYRKLAEDYKSKYKAAYNKMRKSSSKTNLRDQHKKFRVQLFELQKLDGAKFDEARQEFDESVEETFGPDAPQATAFFENAAEIEDLATEVQSEFAKSNEQNSRTYQRDVYQKYQRDMNDMFGSFYDVPDNLVEENPFTLRAYMSGLLKSKDGKQLRKYAESDLKKVTQLSGGIAPFDPDDPKWQGMDNTVARDQWIEEHEQVERQRQGLAPELMMEGIMQRRIVPFLIRRIRELEKKRRRTPQPNGKKSLGKSKKPKSGEEELATASDELDTALANLGS